MKSTTVLKLDRQLSGISLVLAPLLFGLSTFFWEKGVYGIVSAPLLVISTIFWIPALYALFGLLKNTTPRYSRIGLMIALYGCCAGGIGFALLDYFSTIFNIHHESYLQLLSIYPLSANLLLFWPGPLFPLSLLVLSIVLMRFKKIRFWMGLLLLLSAVLFPLSRITRIANYAHLADLLMAVPLVTMGLRLLFHPHPRAGSEIESTSS